MLKEGQKAPAFKLAKDGGGDVSLASQAGKWVVLYFYPRDLTPGCTREAEGFRDAQKALTKLGAVVFGVSKDTVAMHDKFVAKCELNFPLLSDPDGKVIEAYGAWGEKNLYGKKSMGIVRTTVLIDPQGKIARVFPKVKVDGHVDKVVEAIKELA